MVPVQELLTEFQYKYKVLSPAADENLFFSTIGYGLDHLLGSEQMKGMENHLQICEATEFIQAVKSSKLTIFPEIFVLLGTNETFEQLSLLKEQLNQYSVVFVFTKNKAEKMYVQFIKKLNERINHIDSLLDHYYIRLADLLTRDVEISEIEGVANQILGNPMIITDETYKVIAYSQNCEVDDPIWLTIVENTYCPSEIVKMTDYNHFWKRLRNTGQPLFVDSDKFSPYIRRAVAEIQTAGKTKGYIALLERYKRITDIDLKVLQMVAKLIGIKFKEKNVVSKALRKLEADFVSDLLKGKLKNEKMTINRALSLNWAIENWYTVLNVHGKYDQYIGSMVEKVKHKFSDLFSFCACSFNGENAFYIIGHEDKSKFHKDGKEIIEKIMTEHKLIGHVGSSFQSLNEISKSYQQTVNSYHILQLYTEKITQKALYCYSEMAVLDLLLKLGQLIDGNDEYISKPLLTLMNVDQKEGTEYVQTLEQFFNHNQNVASTATTMYLHRNTINYRLNKIREILDEDFDHPSIRLHLHISIILKNLGLINDPLLCN